MTIWTNDDGLRVRFGRTQGENTLTGKAKTFGTTEVATGIIDYSRLPAFGNNALLGNLPVVAIPSGAVIEKVELKIDTTFTSGGAATLDVGLIQEDGTTVVDADGLVAAEAVAGMTEGVTIAGTGSLIDTKTSVDAYLSVNVGTADFTAGEGTVEVTYRRTV